MRSLSGLLAASIVAASCTATPAPPSTTAATVSTTPVATTGPQSPSCGGSETFSASGTLASASAEDSDATRISGLSASHAEDCDRFVVDLSTEAGAPATSVGQASVEFFRDLGVVRVALPEVTETTITDGIFELPLVDRAYVVRSAEGSLYVDVHLRAAAVARGTVTRSPAQIVVEFTPGGAELGPPAPHSDLVVVLTPRGDKAAYPLSVTGYSRTFEANVVVRILKGNSVSVERVTTATDYLAAWGEFSVTLATGPQGRLQVTVGDDSDQDVTLSLVLN